MFKGFVGELGTKISQKLLLDSKQYHIYNDVIIDTGSKTTQIDHIIVSKYGIFVVETKNRHGWIFANEDDDNWIQQQYHSKIRFQNPLRQNYLHTQSLAEFLDIDHSKMHSVVVFWGDCEFKTKKPSNVLTWSEYTGYIKSKNQILLTDSEVDSICNRLQLLKDQTPFLSGVRHAISVNKRYSSMTVCPKCGGNLVERTGHRGTMAGKKFLGCERYPKCRYTKEFNQY